MLAQDGDAVGAGRPAAERGIGEMIDQRLRRDRLAFELAAGGLRRAAEAAQVVWTAGLRAGAGKALAAEGLRADDGADLVTIHVDVAGMHIVDDVLDASVDARVQAEGEAV